MLNKNNYKVKVADGLSEIGTSFVKEIVKTEVPSIVEDKADLVNGKVPAEQLPSYVDDVLEFASLSEFPSEGEEGKIYVALDTNITYRWSGTTYIAIGGANVIANPELSGDEPKLEGLQVGANKFQIPNGPNIYNIDVSIDELDSEFVNNLKLGDIVNDGICSYVVTTKDPGEIDDDMCILVNTDGDANYVTAYKFFEDDSEWVYERSWTVDIARRYTIAGMLLGQDFPWVSDSTMEGYSYKCVVHYDEIYPEECNLVYVIFEDTAVTSGNYCPTIDVDSENGTVTVWSKVNTQVRADFARII